ncbi:hypothetical protein DRN76_00995 [Methanosarcinales archaeon]|nr:MAG: hypothetical protein DRN76_00995 [Methanosarcinales archaeon]
MPGEIFEYMEKESGIFGKVLRPLIAVEIKGETSEWIKIENALADTGADISILPRDIGDLLIKDVTEGEPYEVKGIVPYAKLIVYIHQLKFKLNGKEFELPVAISDSNDVPPIFGRVKGLDLFDANFLNGQKVKLVWE